MALADQTGKRKKGHSFRPIGFAAGLVVGIVGSTAIFAVFQALPRSSLEEPAEAVSDPDHTRPKIEFEFDTELRNAEFKVDPGLYGLKKAPPRVWVLNVATFVDETRAEVLRAELLLLSLEAKVIRVQLDAGYGHQMRVGPFDRKVEAQRVLTRLREQDMKPVLSALPIVEVPANRTEKSKKPRI
jgi:hypothetical protein